MPLTDGVMGWKSSQHAHCTKFLTENAIPIITTQALSGCHNIHYPTEKGKVSALRELEVAHCVYAAFPPPIYASLR